MVYYIYKGRASELGSENTLEQCQKRFGIQIAALWDVWMICRYAHKELIHMNTRDCISNTAIHDNVQLQITEDKNIQKCVSLST